MRFHDVARAVGFISALKLLRDPCHPAWDKNINACDCRRERWKRWFMSLTLQQRRRFLARCRTVWPPHWHRVRFGEDWATDDEAEAYLDAQRDGDPFRTWRRTNDPDLRYWF